MFHPAPTNFILILLCTAQILFAIYKSLVSQKEMSAAWQPDETKIELVGGSDRESAGYIG